jgi:hypothetical protein
LQRRAWNVLLYNAYDKLADVDIYAITIQQICDILEFNSNNQDYLKEALRAMTSCILEWNILEKDKSLDWGVAALLADARIRDGICTYSYGAQLRAMLCNPKMYARISLSLQNRFGSKHAQALWELCLDYLGAAREYGETPYIDLSTFKKLMGIGENSYPSYKRLSEKVIKPAVAEINEVSNLQVTVENQRRARKITALKFKIHRVMLLAGVEDKQPSLFSHLDDMPVAVKVLKDAGLSADEAWKIWQDGFNGVDAAKRPSHIGDDPDTTFTQYIREKIHLLKRRQEQGKVKSATGFLLQAIKQNYGNPEFAESQKTSASWKKLQANLAKKKELEDTRHALEAEYNQKQYALCEQIARDEPERLKTIMEVLTDASSFNRGQYNISKTPLENYLATQGLRSLVDECLMRDCADRFDALRQAHRDTLSSLDAKIEKVKALC